MAHFEDCKFFLGGKCLNDHCAFRHNEAVLLSEQVCKRWAAGYVCDGRCNLRHPSAAELTAITTTPHKPQQQGPETQRELPGKVQKSPVCTFYLRGRCTRGSACGFSHETTAAGPERPPSRENNESPAKVNGNGNGAPPVRKRGLDGKGSLGSVGDAASDSVSTTEAPTSAEMTDAEQSVQAHERQTLISAPGSNAEARMCWFYSKGLCSKGSGCMFSHATQSVGDRAVAIVPQRRENKGTSTSTLRMAAVEARSAARKGVTDAQHASDTSTQNRNQEMVKARADAILRKHSLTKSRATTDSVRDELKIPRGKRMYAKVTSSSKDESPSKRQRMAEVNGRGKDGVDGGTFPVAAKEDVSEEPENDVSNRNGGTLNETWPRDPHVEGDGRASLCPRSAQ